MNNLNNLFKWNIEEEINNLDDTIIQYEFEPEPWINDIELGIESLDETIIYNKDDKFTEIIDRMANQLYKRFNITKEISNLDDTIDQLSYTERLFQYHFNDKINSIPE